MNVGSLKRRAGARETAFERTEMGGDGTETGRSRHKKVSITVIEKVFYNS
jgi:hypothetical protein